MTTSRHFIRFGIIVTALFLIAVLSVCSNNDDAATRGESNSAVNSQAFVTYKYVDLMTKMEVFSMLMPKDWNVEGGITWSADPALPAQSP